jgi:glycosyltransferase involved in cell wall biosynthesis
MKHSWQRHLVTVIIPTFNRREWIGECIDSVLGQTYPNIEVIVVDDRSTDGTVEWLRCQERFNGIVIHEQETNGGASIARNTAIDMARGDLIAFIDSDDKLLPHHVETAVEAFEKHPDLGLFACDSTMIDVDGNELFGGKTWHQALAEATGYEIKTGFRSLKDVFLHSNCFPGFTLGRDVFKELGGFDQSIFPADDYDLALRVAGSRFSVFYRHEPLCLRREHDGQLSGVQNSVKTQVKLIEALGRAARNLEIKRDQRLLKKRFASAEVDLGISQLKEGMSKEGVGTLASGVLRDPGQLSRFGWIIGRKFSSHKRNG